MYFKYTLVHFLMINCQRMDGLNKNGWPGSRAPVFDLCYVSYNKNNNRIRFEHFHHSLL